MSKFIKTENPNSLIKEAENEELQLQNKREKSKIGGENQ